MARKNRNRNFNLFLFTFVGIINGVEVTLRDKVSLLFCSLSPDHLFRTCLDLNRRGTRSARGSTEGDRFALLSLSLFLFFLPFFDFFASVIRDTRRIRKNFGTEIVDELFTKILFNSKLNNIEYKLCNNFSTSIIINFARLDTF